jgi:hypothetical protein
MPEMGKHLTSTSTVPRKRHSDISDILALQSSQESGIGDVNSSPKRLRTFMTPTRQPLGLKKLPTPAKAPLSPVKARGSSFKPPLGPRDSNSNTSLSHTAISLANLPTRSPPTQVKREVVGALPPTTSLPAGPVPLKLEQQDTGMEDRKHSSVTLGSRTMSAGPLFSPSGLHSGQPTDYGNVSVKSETCSPITAGSMVKSEVFPLPMPFGRSTVFGALPPTNTNVQTTPNVRPTAPIPALFSSSAMPAASGSNVSLEHLAGKLGKDNAPSDSWMEGSSPRKSYEPDQAYRRDWAAASSSPMASKNGLPDIGDNNFRQSLVPPYDGDKPQKEAFNGLRTTSTKCVTSIAYIFTLT